MTESWDPYGSATSVRMSAMAWKLPLQQRRFRCPTNRHPCLPRRHGPRACPPAVRRYSPPCNALSSHQKRRCTWL